jgi:hypothetical protein
MMEGENVERSRFRSRYVVSVGHRCWLSYGGQMGGRLSHRGFDALKGRKNIAQAFSPGLAFQKMRPESGARIRSFSQFLSNLIDPAASLVSCASFRARGLRTTDPGLKPWAELFCPFRPGLDRRPRKRGVSIFLSP